MRKRKIECRIEYLKVDGVYNNKVYLYLTGGWGSGCLATCINCGELFFYDDQALFFSKMTLIQRLNGIKCPKCSSYLEKTIEEYPKTFKTKNGSIGHYNETVDPDGVNEVVELWDLLL